MCFIGIDPGLSGAIGIGGKNPQAWDMPIFDDGKKRSLNILALRDLLLSIQEKNPECSIVLEKAQPMPRDGSMGAFRYGEAYGIIKGLVVSMGFPVMEVAPITWKSKIVGKGKDKDASRMLVIQTFPSLASEFKIKKSHNRAEAILLAEYGKRYLS